MNTTFTTITTVCHAGRRRYSLTNYELKIESLSTRKRCAFSDTVLLSNLSDEFFLQHTGNYIPKIIVLAAMAPLPIIGFITIQFPLSPFGPKYSFIAWSAWFFCCVLLGSRRDTVIGIYKKESKDVVYIFGREREQENLLKFVRGVLQRADEVKHGGDDAADNSWARN